MAELFLLGIETTLKRPEEARVSCPGIPAAK